MSYGLVVGWIRKRLSAAHRRSVWRLRQSQFDRVLAIFILEHVWILFDPFEHARQAGLVDPRTTDVVSAACIQYCYAKFCWFLGQHRILSEYSRPNRVSLAVRIVACMFQSALSRGIEVPYMFQACLIIYLVDLRYVSLLVVNSL